MATVRETRTAGLYWRVGSHFLACFTGSGHCGGAHLFSDNAVGGHGAFVWCRLFIDVYHVMLLQFALTVRALDLGDAGLKVWLLRFGEQFGFSRFGLGCAASQQADSKESQNPRTPSPLGT